MEYEESVKTLGAFVGNSGFHDYMSGAMLPSCPERVGIIKSLSVVFKKEYIEVQKDLDHFALEQNKAMRHGGN